MLVVLAIGFGVVLGATAAVFWAASKSTSWLGKIIAPLLTMIWIVFFNLPWTPGAIARDNGLVNSMSDGVLLLLGEIAVAGGLFFVLWKTDVIAKLTAALDRVGKKAKPEDSGTE